MGTGAESKNGNLANIRGQLARLATSKKSRAVPSTAQMPCRWRPGTVTNARSGELFTEAGAWEFIVELLEAGHELEEVELRKPPGRTGYVLKHTSAGLPTLYIKLQLGAGYVYGRSFHYSDTQGSDDE